MRLICILLASVLLSLIETNAEYTTDLTVEDPFFTDEMIEKLSPLPLIPNREEDQTMRVGAIRGRVPGHRCWHNEHFSSGCICCGKFLDGLCYSPPGTVDYCNLYVKYDKVFKPDTSRKTYTLPPNFPDI